MPDQKTFQITTKSQKDKARIGLLQTDHGPVETPVFMPVGTQAAVKSLTPAQVKECGARIVLANTYHLYLRPGEKLIKQLGGLHKFMNWDGPILTDSGGYQIISISHRCQVKPDGLFFTSHIDGQEHFLTPEKVIDIQLDLGSDIIMPLDHPISYPHERSEIAAATDTTTRWAKQSKVHLETIWPGLGQSTSPSSIIPANKPLLFGINQGGTFPDLRKRSAEELMAINFPGYSLGGLCVGEPLDLMHEIGSAVTDILPEDKPRYLMGVGSPEEMLAAVSYGVDMFDCVWPTRLGRHGMILTAEKRLNIRNRQFAEDPRPLVEGCNCHTCQNFSRAYLHHLFDAGEGLAGTLGSIHNLSFLVRLLEDKKCEIRKERQG